MTPRRDGRVHHPVPTRLLRARRGRTPRALSRGRAILASTVVAVAVALAGCGSPPPTGTTGSLVDPSASAAPNPASVDTANTTAGIALSTAPYFDTAAQTRTAYDLASSTGLDSIRLPIQWGLIQPNDSRTFDWAVTDRLVADAVARKLKILATLSSTPAWAAAPGSSGPYARPADPRAYADFAATVARRYAGRIADFEIWNEPNARLFYDPGPDPVSYTAMLVASYRAIKKVDPSFVVVAAGLGAVIDSSSSINPVKFLQDMYANGAAGYFDALSYHPYKYDLSLADAWRLPNSPGQQLSGLRGLMVANGDESKRIWATEYGVPTVAGTATEDSQNALIADFAQKWIELPYTGPAFYYTDRDFSTGDSDPENNFGLTRSDGTYKKALTTLVSYARTGIPTAPVDERFRRSRPDPAWGRVLSPVVPVTASGIAGQIFERATVYSTPMGLISSPTAVANRITPFDTYPISYLIDGYQDMAAGIRVYSSAATGTHVVGNGIVSAWNPRFGLATSDEMPLPGGGVRVQFERGSIRWAQATGGVGTLTP